MRAINLLPQSAVQERRAGLVGYLPFAGAGTVPVIALILVIFGYSSGSSAVSARRAQLATVNAEVAKAVPVTKPASSTIPSTAGLVSERAERLSALESVIADEVAWDTTLLNVARVLPANVWLSSLTATSPTPADAVAPTPAPPTDTTSTTTTTETPTPAPAPAASAPGFTINGYTYTEADVAALLRRLQLLPTLTKVTLVSTTRTPVGKKSLIQFAVNASIQGSSTVIAP